ncbi:MAG: TetR/AcrR family transcriptional regulator [Actinomycetota bacterium]|nr:TetR/AcrR family transcriptional regulator [Actinomycetota bacterium]
MAKRPITSKRGGSTAANRTAKPARAATSAVPQDPDRFPSGRRRSPLGVREGGEAWEQVHVQFAREALRLLAEFGYAGMGMDEVARAAGASTRTIYRHYATKVDLAVAAIGQLPTMAGWIDGDDALEVRVSRALSISAAHPEYLVPVLANAIVYRNTVPELLGAFRDHVLAPRRAVISTFVTRDQAAGAIREDVSADVVSTFITGAMVESFIGRKPAGSTDRRIDVAVRQLLPLIKP